jgi:uncharacterized protein YggT (Ycf19 family)
MGVIATPSLLLDTISQVQQFVRVFLLVYAILIFAYVITSWVRLPYSTWLNRIQRFLYDVCEPYLRLFRRFLPPFGPLDMSPFFAVLVLVLLGYVINSILDQFH